MPSENNEFQQGAAPACKQQQQETKIISLGCGVKFKGTDEHSIQCTRIDRTGKAKPARQTARQASHAGRTDQGPDNDDEEQALVEKNGHRPCLCSTADP